MISKAIVRELSPNYKNCISSHPQHSNLLIERARSQHKAYIDFLSDDLGLEVIPIEGDPNYPDCCFIEDTAVIQGNKAMICRTGAESRRGEIDEVEKIVSQYFTTQRLDAPHTMEGGDVLHFDGYLISGITQRTSSGAPQMLHEFMGIPVYSIEDLEIIHLKSYVSRLDENTVLVTEKYKDHEVIGKMTKIVVPHEEAYAANVLSINDMIIIPSGYPKTTEILEEYEYEVQTLDMSEFAKCEGALTCLSLRF